MKPHYSKTNKVTFADRQAQISLFILQRYALTHWKAYKDLSVVHADSEVSDQTRLMHGLNNRYSKISLFRFCKNVVHLSCVMRKYEPRHEKTNVLVSDLVRQKPGCKATEYG